MASLSSRSHQRLVRALALGVLLVAEACPAFAAGAAFGSEPASVDARSVADWAVDSHDSRGLPFLVVDKVQAKVFVFTADGALRGAAPALLGSAIGDDSAPGIGERALAAIKPAERTTPAGRFVASIDRNLHGREILWIDYDAGIALHRVAIAVASERRTQRLATATASDNRISFGCINVAARFYDEVVHAAFAAAGGIVYVLPETRPARAEFGIADVN